jgi:hypothetical protein
MYFNIFNLNFFSIAVNLSMIKQGCYIVFIFSTLLFFYKPLAAQDIPAKNDTFFLAKKSGLLGKLGRSISTTPPDEKPVKVENPFLKFKGKIIRSVETISLGFEYNIDDTTQIESSFGVSVGKRFHKNTSDKVIRNNLFFREGGRVFPYLFADNERYLRDLIFIQDARIFVELAEGSTDSVDVVVLTKDVFSIGGKLLIGSINDGRGEVSEENFLGSGTRLQFSFYHDQKRFPQNGVGGELIKRNIGGSFIDLVAGYKDYKYAFSSGRNEETIFYTRLEKPLVTPYIPSTGALEWSYQRTRNTYHTEALYKDSIKYSYYTLDGWLGYSIDSKRALYENKEIRRHRFIALRGFKQFYQIIPAAYKTGFNKTFTDFTGALASLNIFKQVFYKTKFIYGFGRNEDIPEGFSVAITAGYINKQTIKRPYSGLDISFANFKKKGFYSNFTFRAGGYFYRKRFEDVDLLFNFDHFTRLRKLSSNWFNRVFFATGITAQANPVLNTPLYLNSDFGLPYFNNGLLSSDLRATIKAETVFYNTKKVLGFRFAPFVFADAILLKPTKMSLKQSDIFTAVGGGIRTRNENLVFGTIELRGYWFPRVNGDMKGWKVELNSNIRFKFRSSFISRPDFIIAN